MGHLGIQWLLHDRRTACLHIAMQSDLQILGQQHNRQVRSPRCLYSQHIVYRPCHRCSHPAHANLDPPRPQDAHRSQIDGHCVLVLWRRCHHRRRSTHERLSQGLRHWRSRTRSDIRSGLHPFQYRVWSCNNRNLWSDNQASIRSLYPSIASTRRVK